MIVVVGEALIDLVIAGDGRVEASLGGAPFNTAGACGRLDVDVSFVGPMSEDRFGRLLDARLVADGVDTTGAPIVDAPTTLAAAELDEGGAATYRFYIAGTSAPMLTEVPAVSGDVLFTGGLALVLEPMSETVASMVDQFGGGVVDGGADVMVMVDVNCRPRVIADRERYVERVWNVLARTDIVKVSDDDLGYLLPGTPPLDAARSLLTRGPAAVLLTAGAAGAHVLTATGERFVPATPVTVVDTVGAGDSFGAGFLAAWTEGGDLAGYDDIDRLADAAAFGSRVASIVCGRRGADPPSRSDLVG